MGLLTSGTSVASGEELGLLSVFTMVEVPVVLSALAVLFMGVIIGLIGSTGVVGVAGAFDVVSEISIGSVFEPSWADILARSFAATSLLTLFDGVRDEVRDDETGVLPGLSAD